MRSSHILRNDDDSLFSLVVLADLLRCLDLSESLSRQLAAARHSE